MHAQHQLYDAGTLLDFDSRTDRDFYVTIRDGSRVGWLLGPYATHDVAHANVDRARTLAVGTGDPRASFAEFGTASLPKGTPVKVVFGS